MPDPPDFTDLRSIGDTLTPELRAQLLRFLDGTLDATTIDGQLILAQLQEALRTRDIATAFKLIDAAVAQRMVPKALPFMNTFLNIMLQAGEAVIASSSLELPLRPEVSDTARRVAFDRSITMMEDIAGDATVYRMSARVADITDGAIGGMREVLVDGLKRGVGADKLGRELRSFVSLLPQHATALRNYTEGLAANKNVSDAFAAKLSQRYRDRLLAYRALNIARTESMYAVHAGMMSGWLSLMQNGILIPQRTWIEWVVTEDDRLCDRCAPMHGKRVKMGIQFESSERGFPAGVPTPHVNSPYDRRMTRRGPLKPRIPILKADSNVLTPLKESTLVYHPPLHPSCRCTLKLHFG